jgi:TolA-binding protein
MKMTKTKGFVLLCSALLFAAAAWGAPAAPDRQEALALEYQLSIARLPSSDAAAREPLFLRLIDECPATEAAEEAYWALSNLYLDDFDEPKEDKAREILEKFLKQYPSSQWVSHVKNRLSWLRGETQR